MTRAEVAAWLTKPRSEWWTRLGFFLMGVCAAGAAAGFTLGHELWAPYQPPMASFEVHTHEKTRQTVKRKKAVDTWATATPGFLRTPDGGVLLNPDGSPLVAYTFLSGSRERSGEDSTATRELDTSSKTKVTPAAPISYFRIGVGVGFGKPLAPFPSAPGLLIGGELDVRLPLDKLPVPLPPQYGVNVGVRGGNYGGLIVGSFNF